MGLSDFLVLAKRNAYIGEDSVRENYKISEDGFSECVFSRDNYKYRDRYFGSEHFAGEEVVYQKQKPVWAMNYYGQLIEKDIPTKEVFNFLGKMLSEVPAAKPFRGPKFCCEGQFTYINHIEGDIEDFRGLESILFDGEKVYMLYYHGGTIN
jgi:hypothetical protein